MSFWTRGVAMPTDEGRSIVLMQANEADWHAYRSLPSARECETNGPKIALWIKPYAYSGINYAACEVVIIGEAAGLWFELKVYMAKTDEIMERLPEIEAKLVAAWNALATDGTK